MAISLLALGGSATLVVETETAGNYALTLLYSNNDEQGVHDYNVDLIEDFVSISVNVKLQKELYCRSNHKRLTTHSSVLLTRRGGYYPPVKIKQL